MTMKIDYSRMSEPSIIDDKDLRIKMLIDKGFALKTIKFLMLIHRISNEKYLNWKHAKRVILER